MQMKIWTFELGVLRWQSPAYEKLIKWKKNKSMDHDLREFRPSIWEADIFRLFIHW